MHTIETAKGVFGYSADEVAECKMELTNHCHTLIEKGSIEITSADPEVRATMVSIQALFEHVLAIELNLGVKDLIGIIHTPKPATPLCTSKIENPAEFPLAAFSADGRTEILREFMRLGGNLYVVYPKAGLTERTADEQRNYHEALLTNSAHLFDRPLDCEALDPELSGATYIFKSGAKKYIFAVKAAQSGTKNGTGSFGLWLGEYNSEFPAFDRIKKISGLICNTEHIPFI